MTRTKIKSRGVTLIYFFHLLHEINMAEHAAHVTATSFSVRPSIFEILAQDGLNRIIQPAVKHAARVRIIYFTNDQFL